MRSPGTILSRGYPRGAGRWLAIALAWLGFALSAHATDYTWTNTATGASGFWTNGSLWATPANSPGANPGDNAYLTNNTGTSGSYTDILNRAVTFTLGTLAISNSTGGQAWLVLTNATLFNTTFTLGNGGGLQIDNGGILAGITTLNWLGTNGVLRLNNGGTLATAGPVTIGNGLSGITGLVTSASSIGQGGIWQLNNQPLTIGNAGSFNILNVNNANLTNVGAVVIGNGVGDSFNGLTLSNGAGFAGGNLTVGNSAGASNNFFNVGGLGAAVTVSNGSITVGLNGAANNSLTLTNANLLSTGAIIIGNNASSNTVTVLTNTLWNVNAQPISVGANTAVGNVLTINGGIVTNVAGGAVTIGTVSAGYSNLLAISNGGQWFGGVVTIVGNSNAYNVGGLGAASFVSNGLITVGNLTGYDAMTATNATLFSGGLTVGAGGGSSNTVAVQVGTTWNMLNSAINVGNSANATSNSLAISGGIVTNVAGATVTIGAAGTGYSNLLAISNGGQWLGGVVNVAGSSNAYNVGGLGAISTVSNAAITVGNAAGANFNTMTVTHANLWSGALIVGSGANSNTVNVNAGATWNLLGANLTVGSGVATGNTLVISGGVVTNVPGVTISASATSSGNSLVLTNGGRLISYSDFNLGQSGTAGTGTVYLSDTSYLSVSGGNGVLMWQGGVIVQGGGTNTSSQLSVLNGGQYRMSGGFLTSANLGVGAYSGGGAGAGNVLTFSGGQIKGGGIIGGNHGGSGTVTQSGGVWDLAGATLNIGGTTAGVGFYNMTGGFITNGSVTLGTSAGALGTLTISGSSYIQLAGGLTVGSAGTGIVNQTGGVVNGNGQSFSLGSGAGSWGNYTLNGGVMTNFNAGTLGVRPAATR